MLGWTSEGKVVQLRKASNDLLCLADDPRNDNFSVACYHKDLEPFMARGRELANLGHKGKERHQIRWKDVDEGRVEMPREPRMLYVMTGKGLRRRQGRGDRVLSALGRLYALRNARIDRPACLPRQRALVDVPGQGRRPHHD